MSVASTFRLMGANLYTGSSLTARGIQHTIVGPVETVAGLGYLASVPLIPIIRTSAFIDRKTQ